MTPSQQYRTLAAGLKARARHESDPEFRTEWQVLADCYVRLAEQADRNSRTDVTYEPILRHICDADETSPK